MKLTNHATKRVQQRDINDEVLLLVSLFREEVASDNGVVKIQMTEKTRRKLFQVLDKCRSKVIIADRNVSKMITAYTLTR